MRIWRLIALGCVFQIGLPLPLRGQAPTQYFCNADEITGYYFENGKWGVANFNSPPKYVFKETVSPDRGPTWGPGEKIWELTEVGDSFSIARCSDWTTNMNGQRERTAIIECHGIYKMKFNKTSLRFLLSYFAGYIDGTDDNRDTPYLAIGKCSPL